jgi:hypothetical protein
VEIGEQSRAPVSGGRSTTRRRSMRRMRQHEIWQRPLSCEADENADVSGSLRRRPARGGDGGLRDRDLGDLIAADWTPWQANG